MFNDDIEITKHKAFNEGYQACIDDKIKPLKEKLLAIKDGSPSRYWVMIDEVIDMIEGD